ncbi:MAG: hypothetical protein ABL974_20730, partial [Prosthecobacter sp.]
MKECPILFSGPMVRAILDGRKTQTRRIVKPQPSYLVESKCSTYATSLVDRHGDLYPGLAAFGVYSEEEAWPCPYGQPGDRLWVRETHRYDGLDPNIAKQMRDPKTVQHRSDADDEFVKWLPSIHMPRWASRITLEIVSVRVERLQDITEADAIAEGIERDTECPHLWVDYL